MAGITAIAPGKQVELRHLAEFTALYRATLVLFVFALGSLSPRAKAQPCGANAQSPIATDRPQITASSIVVPCGSLQFENGFEETENGGQRGFDFPETSVRFGVANKRSFVSRCALGLALLCILQYVFDLRQDLSRIFGRLSGLDQQVGVP